MRRYDFRHNHEVRPDLVHFPPKRRRTRKEKEADEAAAASAPVTSTDAAVSGSNTAPGKLPLGMRKHDAVTRVSPGGAFRHPPGLTFASEEVDVGIEEGEVDEDDELDGDDDDEEDDLPQIYLSSNGYGHQNLLEGEFVFYEANKKIKLLFFFVRGLPIRFSNARL